jgi:hypothetical protein
VFVDFGAGTGKVVLAAALWAARRRALDAGAGAGDVIVDGPSRPGDRDPSAAVSGDSDGGAPRDEGAAAHPKGDDGDDDGGDDHDGEDQYERFAECRGVELVPSLYAESERLAAAWRERVAPLLWRGGGAVRLACGDMLVRDALGDGGGGSREADWREADVAFACSTCFDRELMLAIGERAQLLRRGAWLVTLTKQVPPPPSSDGAEATASSSVSTGATALSMEAAQSTSPAPVLRLVLRTQLKMSWSSATVYFQQRV